MELIGGEAVEQLESEDGTDQVEACARARNIGPVAGSCLSPSLSLTAARNGGSSDCMRRP
jgi:hypothetical protein